MTDKIQRSVNVETPKAHIKSSDYLPERFKSFFDVSEVFRVNSQAILRLTIIDIHCHNNTAPVFGLKTLSSFRTRGYVILVDNVKTSV